MKSKWYRNHYHDNFSLKFVFLLTKIKNSKAKLEAMVILIFILNFFNLILQIQSQITKH